MDRQMNIALRKTLDQIGVKHSLKGYGYIISAVEKCLETEVNLSALLKDSILKSQKKTAIQSGE